MTDGEMKAWHDQRESLFPTRIPYSAIASINQQLPKLEFQRASAALTAYSQEKPYRGFYMTRFHVHYERQPSAVTDAPERAAPPGNDEGEDSHYAERREREAYAALPSDFIEACQRKYSDWGWPIGSRAWRLICLDAYVGRDVSRYKIGTNIFTQDRNRAEEMREKQAYMDRVGYVKLIGELRNQVAMLGGNIDVVV